MRQLRLLRFLAPAELEANSGRHLNSEDCVCLGVAGQTRLFVVLTAVSGERRGRNYEGLCEFELYSTLLCQFEKSMSARKPRDSSGTATEGQKRGELPALLAWCEQYTTCTGAAALIDRPRPQSSLVAANRIAGVVSMFLFSPSDSLIPGRWRAS